MARNFSYETAAGHRLALTLFGNQAFDQQPCLVYAHGFKGFKDWGFVPHAATYLARAGFSVITFNFSHNGIGPDGETFSETEAFAQNTLSLELTELEEVLHLAAHTDFFGAYLRHPLGLIGHSRGGGLALLAGAASREVRAVCSWAAVSTFERYSKQVRADWREKGFLEVVNSRTGQVLHMNQTFLDDLEAHAADRLNVMKAVKEMNKPLLILHGAEDETVPYFEAEQLNIFADPARTEMRLIPRAGHTFGAVHPFAGTTPALEELLTRTEAFFVSHLKA
ncbi:MAG: alpha/beta fold hydrolase [Bacteroidetes bacterium]|nr:MAG: alpha/beta fold hydrolase [Bacteroidota bacterium]